MRTDQSFALAKALGDRQSPAPALGSRRAKPNVGCRPVLVEKLGEGGEAEVFALDDRRVLRKFRRVDHPAIEERVSLTHEIAGGAGSVDFMVPEILDVYEDEGGHPCFIERRLPGRSLTDALGDVDGRRRELLLGSYMATAQTIRSIEFTRPWHGELLRHEPLRTSSWSEFLADALERQRSDTDPARFPEVTDFDSVVARLQGAVRSVPEPVPSLVHFDYFPGNVLCDDTRVLAVIDWSVLSIVGDPDLDLALAMGYLGVTPTATESDAHFAQRWLAEHGLAERASFYQRWGAAWWAPATFDRRIRSWVASVLGQPV